MFSKSRIIQLTIISLLLAVALFLYNCFGNRYLFFLPEETIRITPIDYYSEESLSVFRQTGVKSPTVYQIDYNTRLKGNVYLEVWRDSIRSKIDITQINPYSTDTTITRKGTFQIEVSYKDIPLYEKYREKILIRTHVKNSKVDNPEVVVGHSIKLEPATDQNTTQREIEFEILEQFKGHSYSFIHPGKQPSLSYNIDLDKGLRYYYFYLEKYGVGEAESRIGFLSRNLGKNFSKEKYDRGHNYACLNSSLIVLLRVEFFEQNDHSSDHPLPYLRAK